MSKFYQQQQQSLPSNSSKRPRTQVQRDNVLESSLESSKALNDKEAATQENYLRMYTTLPFNMKQQMKAMPQQRTKVNHSNKPYQLQQPMQFSNQYHVKKAPGHFQKISLHYAQMQKDNIGFPYLEKQQDNLQNIKDRYSSKLANTRSQSRQKLLLAAGSRTGSRDRIGTSNRSSGNDLQRSQRSFGQTFQKSNSKSSMNRSMSSSQKQRYRENHQGSLVSGLKEFLNAQNQLIQDKKAKAPNRIVPEKLKQAFSPSSNKSHFQVNYKNLQNRSVDDTSEISHNTMLVQQMYDKEFRGGAGAGPGAGAEAAGKAVVPDKNENVHQVLKASQVHMSPAPQARKLSQTQNSRNVVNDSSSGAQLTINVQQNARNSTKSQTKGRSATMYDNGGKQHLQKKRENMHWRIVNSTQQKIDVSQDVENSSSQKFMQHYFEHLNQTSLNLFKNGGTANGTNQRQTVTMDAKDTAMLNHQLQSEPTPQGRRPTRNVNPSAVAAAIRVSRTANGFQIMNSTQGGGNVGGGFTPVKNERNEPIPNIDNPYRNSILDVSYSDQKGVDANIIIGPAYKLNHLSPGGSYDHRVDQQRAIRTGDHQQRQRVLSSINDNEQLHQLQEHTNYMYKRKARFSQQNTPQNIQVKSNSLHQRPRMQNFNEMNGAGGGQGQVIGDLAEINGGHQLSNILPDKIEQQDTPSNARTRTQKIEKSNKYNNGLNPTKIYSATGSVIINHHNSRSNPAPIFKNSKTKLMSIYKNGGFEAAVAVANTTATGGGKSQSTVKKAEVGQQSNNLPQAEEQIQKDSNGKGSIDGQVGGATSTVQGQEQEIGQQDGGVCAEIGSGNKVAPESTIQNNNDVGNQEKINPKRQLDPLKPVDQHLLGQNYTRTGQRNQIRHIGHIGGSQQKQNYKDTLPKLKRDQIILPADRKNSNKHNQPAINNQDVILCEGKVNSQIIEQSKQISTIGVNQSTNNQSTKIGSKQDDGGGDGTRTSSKAHTVHVRSKHPSVLKMVPGVHHGGGSIVHHSTSQSKLQLCGTQDSGKPSQQVPNLKSNLTTHLSREYEGGDMPGLNNSTIFEQQQPAAQTQQQRGKKSKIKNYQRNDFRNEMSPYIEEANNVWNGQQYNGGQSKMKSTELVNSLSQDRLKQSKFIYRNYHEVNGGGAANLVKNHRFIEHDNPVNNQKSSIERRSPSKMMTIAMSPELMSYTPDFVLNSSKQFQNDQGFLTGEQLEELQDQGIIDQFNNQQNKIRNSVLIASKNEQDHMRPPNELLSRKKARQPTYIFDKSKRDFLQQTMDELIELCIEKEAQYSDTVSNLKQSLIDENSMIPGSQINESSFQPMEEQKLRSNGMPSRPRKPTERTICESISAYSIYPRNLTTLVDKLYFPESQSQDERLFSPDNNVFQKLCLPKFVISSYPSNAAMKDIQNNDGVRKMLVQIKHQFKDHRYILTPVGISQLQRSYIDLHIYQMEYYNQSLIIKQQQQVYGVNRTDEAFFTMAKIPYQNPQEKSIIRVTNNKRLNEMHQVVTVGSPNNFTYYQQDQSQPEKQGYMRNSSQQRMRITNGSQVYSGSIGLDNLNIINGENLDRLDLYQPNLQSYLKVRKQKNIQSIKNAYTFNSGPNANMMHQSQLKQKSGAYQVKAPQTNMSQTQGPFYQKGSISQDMSNGNAVVQKFKVNQKQVLLEPLTPLKPINQTQIKDQDHQQDQIVDQSETWQRKTRKSFNIPVEQQFEDKDESNQAQRCITSNQALPPSNKNPFAISDQVKGSSQIQAMGISPQIEVREVEIGSDVFNSCDEMNVGVYQKVIKEKEKQDKAKKGRQHEDTSETHEHFVEPHINLHNQRLELSQSHKKNSMSYHNLQSSDHHIKQTNKTFSNHMFPSIQQKESHKRANSRSSNGIDEQQQSILNKIEISNKPYLKEQYSSIGNQQDKGQSDYLPILASGKQTISIRSSDGRINSIEQSNDALQFIVKSSKEIFNESQSPEYVMNNEQMPQSNIDTPMMSNSNVNRDQSRSERIFKKNQATYNIYNQSHQELKKLTKTDRRFKESLDYQSQNRLHDEYKSSQNGSPLQHIGKKNKYQHQQLSQPPILAIQDQPSVIFASGPCTNPQSTKPYKKNKQLAKDIGSYQLHMRNSINNNGGSVNQASISNKTSGLDAYKSKLKKLMEIEKECIRELNNQGSEQQSHLISPKRRQKNKNGGIRVHHTNKGNKQTQIQQNTTIYNIYDPGKQNGQQTRKSAVVTSVKPIVPGKHLMNSLNFAGITSINQSPHREKEPASRRMQSLHTDRQHAMKI